ncbi:hypothetical protein ACLMAJ_28775 [Nocardia sp. KC 131]|uniref:hypothetical protein n=1 Tax=Nocardia arseniciresistens TaxID=3392119 RepID=UPI00398ECD92
MTVVALLAAMAIALLAGIAFGVLTARDEQAVLREVVRRRIAHPSRYRELPMRASTTDVWEIPASGPYSELRAHLMGLKAEGTTPATVEPRLHRSAELTTAKQTPI